MACSDSCSEQCPSIAKWLAFLDQAVSRNRSHLFEPSTLKAVDDQLSNLVPGTRHEKWRSWVNSLPDCWRERYTACTSSDWEKAYNILHLTRASSTSAHKDDVPRSVNVRSWIGAVMFMMERLQGGQRRRIGHYLDFAAFCSWMGDDETKRLLDPISLFEEDPFVAKYRGTLQKTHHICCNASHWADYASAVFLATENDPSVFMPFIRSEWCAMCNINKCLWDFVETGKNFPADGGSQHRVDRLLQEIVSGQKKLILNLTYFPSTQETMAVQRGLRFERPMSETISHQSTSLPVSDKQLEGDAH